MDQAQTVAQNTLDRLKKVGWSVEGPTGPNGEECVLVAALGVSKNDVNAYMAFRSAMASRIGYWSVGTWNDKPDTTFDMVESTLLEIVHG